MSHANVAALARMLADEAAENGRLADECQWAAQTIADLTAKATQREEFIQWLTDHQTNEMVAYREEVRNEWSADCAVFLEMCQDEAAALNCDLDDMQAEWAKDVSSKAAGLSLFSTAQNRKHSELALADARISELEALDRQQVAHVDEFVAENERLSVANEHQRAALERLDSLLLERTREYAAVHNELLEERRLRVAAFERNAELEARTLDLNNQTGGAEAQRTHEAADALQAIIRKQTDGELIRALHGVLGTLRGPQAPSVPRRLPA